MAKKAVGSFEAFLASRQLAVNPESAKLVSAIDTYQDSKSGKKAVRVRVALGGKVVAITLIAFEDLVEAKGQWVPTVTRIKADTDTVASTIEAIEEKGAELEPETRVKEDTGESEDSEESEEDNGND